MYAVESAVQSSNSERTRAIVINHIFPSDCSEETTKKRGGADQRETSNNHGGEQLIYNFVY